MVLLRHGTVCLVQFDAAIAKMGNKKTGAPPSYSRSEMGTLLHLRRRGAAGT